jgi:prepilin-type N-terminal cleavage/methylation domain-containing protein
MRRLEAGYSLIEMMLVVGIMGVVGSMAVIQLGLSQPAMQGDGAMRVIMAQLNAAREMSIAQRRQMQLGFVSPNQITISRIEVPAAAQPTLLTTVYLEGGIQYGLISGISDTPDAFGNSSSTYFGAATAIRFNSDGTLVDQTGSPLNGTVFVALPGRNINSPGARSFRGITIFGGTGRVRGYRWDGRRWMLA